MNMPSMEQWREYLLRKGFDEGYEKGKSEMKVQKVVDTEEMNRRIQALLAEHERAMADLTAGYEAKLRRLNMTYENRRNLDHDKVRHLEMDIKKIQKNK